MKTLTVEQLITLLRKEDPASKVFIASDEEGNSYGTLDEAMSIEKSKEDNAIYIYPFEQFTI